MLEIKSNLGINWIVFILINLNFVKKKYYDIFFKIRSTRRDDNNASINSLMY